MVLGPAWTIVTSLAFSSTFESDGTAFAGTLRQGLFRSTDAGEAWVPVNDGLTDPTVSSVVLSPAFESDGTLLVSTLGGVFRSHDRGKTWRQVSDNMVAGMIGSPASDRDRTLFAETRDGVARSTDAGETWQPVDQRFLARSFLARGFARPVAFSPAFERDRTVFGITKRGGVMRSTDVGDTWETLVGDSSGRYEGIDVQALGFSPAFGTDNTLFAFEQQNGVLRSTDGGATWKSIGGPVGTGPYLASLAVSPAFETDNTLYLGLGLTQNPPQAVSRFTDGTWRQIAGTDSDYNTGCLTASVHFLAVSPAFANDNTLFAGTLNQGLFRSDDGGDSWQPVKVGSLKYPSACTWRSSPSPATPTAPP